MTVAAAIRDNAGGASAPTMAGSGTLVLSGTNTFSGNTLVNSGTLVLANPQSLPQSTLVANGGAVGFGGLGSAMLGGLAGPGTLALANSASSALALSVGNNSANTTFSGMLQGPGSLTKVGSGTLLLSGPNTYTGPTTISQGKLVVDGWLTNSAVSVNGGTLGGSGNLSSITVNPGGTLAPGDSQGVLNLSGNLTLLSGAAMDYELDGFSADDEVSLPTGSLSLNNQQFTDFTFTPLAGFAPGTYDLIAFASTSGSLGANRSGAIDGYAATLAVQGNDLVLNVVPEPSSLVLLATGTLGLLGCGLRRRAARDCQARGLRRARGPSHPLLPIAFVPCGERRTTGSLIRKKSTKRF